MAWEPVYGNGRFLFEFDPDLFRIRIKRGKRYYEVGFTEIVLQTVTFASQPQPRPWHDSSESHPDLTLDE